VRAYGQMLEKDHSDANKKAAEAAKSIGVTPPSEPNSKQIAAYDRMSKRSGAKFDGEFAKHMGRITRRTSRNTRRPQRRRMQPALTPTKPCRRFANISTARSP
jgi:predicted outer membrane protein